MSFTNFAFEFSSWHGKMVTFDHQGKTVWNASLVNTDLKRNTNSYYKLQVRFITLLVPKCTN